MSIRFRNGQNGRNLWKNLAEISERDMELAMKSRQSDTDEPTDSDYEALRPYDCSDQLPDDIQQKLVSALIKRSLLPAAAATLPLFDKAGRTRFREVLSQVLIQAWDAVRTLESLVKSSNIKGLNGTDILAENLETISRSLLLRAKEARKAFQLLSSIRYACEDQVLKTLKWLADIFPLRRTTMDAEFVKTGTGSNDPSSSVKGSSSPQKAQSSSPTKPSLPPVHLLPASGSLAPETSSPVKKLLASPQMPYRVETSSPTRSSTLASGQQQLPAEPYPTSSYPAYPSSPPPAETLLDAGETADLPLPVATNFAVAEEDDLATSATMEFLRLDEEGDANDENLEMEDLAADENRGWAYAAQRYLQLVCSHTDATRLLVFSESQPQKSAAIKQYLHKMTLSVVVVKPQWTDTTMIPFDRVLDNLGSNEDDCAMFKAWLQKQPRVQKGDKWAKPNFTGSWHCETILLSLHALSLSFDAENSKPSIDTIQHALRGMADVPDKVIETVKNRGNLLT
ncbi:MAG: hypothetical protein L6R42_008490, partial [Xanthoria sp. 1 TBL-2021]